MLVVWDIIHTYIHVFTGAWHLPNQSSCLNQNVTQHFMFQHCQPMRNHNTEQLHEGNRKINSEKVSGQSSSIQLVHPLYTSMDTLKNDCCCLNCLPCRRYPGPLHRDQHPQHGGGGLLGAQVPHQGAHPAEEEPINGANRDLYYLHISVFKFLL